MVLQLLVVAMLAVASKLAMADTHSDCGIAQMAFGMCVPYVMGQEHQLSAQCCQAVQSVRSLATTPQARKSICQCLRLLMVSVGKIDPGRAAGLSVVCRVGTRVIPTSLTFDCTKVA